MCFYFCNFIISSGLKEIIQGSSIYKKFKSVFACEYVYDNKGVACWPKLMINYTLKTQFVFRISKGAIKISDDDKVNSRISKDKRRVLYRDMIYIGDGMTDIACMTLVKKNGGTSIAVYPEKDIQKVKQIYDDHRCDFVVPSNYSSGSRLEKAVQLIIDKVIINEEINNKQEQLANLYN